MTCIVGLISNDIVYIGGDRSASDGESILSIKTPKVEAKGNWIYGYAGTIGIGQLMSFINLPPECDDPYIYIRMSIVEELKTAMESFTNPQETHDTSWLIGYKDRLFELSSSDWGVVEIDHSSIGTGNNYALGSLYTSIDKDPIERIGMALGAAITYSPSCVGPVDILYTSITNP